MKFHSKRYSTFYKHIQWDTQRLLVWTLVVACKSVHFDIGDVFLSSVEKQVIKTLKRLKGVLIKLKLKMNFLQHQFFKFAVSKVVVEECFPFSGGQNVQPGWHAASKEEPSCMWHQLSTDPPCDFHRVFCTDHFDIYKQICMI